MSLKRLIIVFGEAQFNYTPQKCIIKQIGSSDILIIHCNKRLVGLIVQPFIFSFLVKVQLGQVGVGLENVKTHSSASLKSYIVIIIPKAYDVLTTSNIRSSWGQFNNCSTSFTWPLGR